MKKINLLFIFVLSILLVSCSSEDNVINYNIREPKAIDNLKHYNDSVLKTRVITRSPSLNLKVAFADCTGAASGIAAGHKIGSALGFITGGTGYFVSTIGCGVIWGAICSYMATNVSNGESYDTNRIVDFLEVSKDVISNNITIVPNVEDATTIRNWRHSLYNKATSNKDQYVNKIGLAHNNLLDGQLKIDKNILDQVTVKAECKLPNIRATREDCIVFNKIINTDEFYKSYFQISNSIQKCFVNDSFDVDLFFKENKLVSSKVEEAIKQYGVLYTQYPQNTEDIEKITNDYIQIIEESEEFTDEEKDIIYSALNVSIYSPKLWNDFK